MLSALLMILIVLFISWHKSNMTKFRTFIKNQNDFTKGQLIQLLLTNFVVVFISFLMLVFCIGVILEDFWGFDVKNNIDIVFVIAIICGFILSIIGDFFLYHIYSEHIEEKNHHGI